LIKNNIGKVSPVGWTNDGSLYYSATSAKEGLHFISIRLGGKQVAFSAGMEPKQGIWVLENIFAEEAGKDQK
jgi:hypothetical protein